MNPLAVKLRSFISWFWLTPVEWALVLLIGWLVVWGAWPRYERWRIAGRLRDEQYVVVQVRAALTGTESTLTTCPAQLDTCPDGSTAENCAFFADILPTPPPLSGWRKENGLYLGPGGGWYRYDPKKCRFLPVSAPHDSS